MRAATSRLAHAMEARDTEERTRVLRALLRQPLIRARTEPDLFRLARRHAEWIRTWLDRETGWRLITEPEMIRLAPSYVPHGPTAGAIAAQHPARARRVDPPFTRRRYVLLCLALAALERSDTQISLGRLAEEVVLLARAPGLEDVIFSLAKRDERSDLVAVIRLLLDVGALARVAGDEESYISSGGDALYDVDRRALAALLTPQHGPALAARRLPEEPAIEEIEAALHELPAAFTDDEINRRIRQSVSRRLLSDPVVYYDELPDAEREYLVSGQRVALTRRVAEATGLIPELRAEGIALVDPDDQLTDLRMPEQGTDGHATLLIAEHLASNGAATVREVRRMVRKLAEQHASYWRKSAREPGAESAIVAAVVDRLVGLGLVRVTGDGRDAEITPLPALARFAVTEPVIRTRKER